MTVPSLNTQQDEDDARHEGGHHQAVYAILLYDAIDDYDKGSRRAANLHFAAPKEGDDKTGHNSRDDAFFGTDPRSDTEGNGQRKRHNADNDTGHEVGHEIGLAVILKRSEKLGLEVKSVHTY